MFSRKKLFLLAVLLLVLAAPALRGPLPAGADSAAVFATPQVTASDVSAGPASGGADPVCLAAGPDSFPSPRRPRAAEPDSPASESSRALPGRLDGLRGNDSPDGDPQVRQWTFPAAAHPLTPPSGGRGAAGRELLEDFVLAGVPPEGDGAAAAAFTTDGARIIVAHVESRNLILFDAATRAFVAEIPLSGSPQDLAVSADGVHAVTANVYEDTASIVDLLSGTEIAVVPVGDQPGVVRITPSGATAVVGNTVESTLSVIDIASATELRRIPGAGFVASISVNFEPGAVAASFSPFELAGETTAVHADYYGNHIDLFDLSTGTATTLASLGTPRGVAVTPDGTKAVVTHVLSVQRLSVIDVAGGVISKTIAVGTNLDGPVAIRPDGTKAVVAVLNACRVVNLVTDAVSANLDTASVYRLMNTANGLFCLAVGFRGSLIGYTSETILSNLNNIVSTPVGAISPADPRAAMAANVFGEDMVVSNTNGAFGYVEGTCPSGAPPEGDKCRDVALSADGATAVAVNIFSDNASIVDLEARVVEAVVGVGDRPAEAEISPDGSLAVVANLDSSFASVIDLAAHSATSVTISRRASQVEISPDGQYAYLAVVADGDGVWRLTLDPPAVAGPKLTTGDMGSISYSFNQSSGMTLSHDGATLVTCNSFNDSLTLVDTASWSVAATVAVGDFPVRALFSADDSLIYVSHRDDDTVRAVTNAGPGSAVVQTIAVGDWPLDMVLSPDGGTLFVCNYLASTVGVVNLAAGMMTSAVALPSNPAGLALDAAGANLLVSSGTWWVTFGPGPAFSVGLEGYFSVVDPKGPGILDEVDTGLPPATMRRTPGGLAVVPSPFGDGLTLVESPLATVSTELTCLPAAGTVPFATHMTATLGNLSSVFTRTLAGRIDLDLAGGQHFSNWRSGYTNVAPAGSFVTDWNLVIPAMGSVIGDNRFYLLATDVTPSPYNQPPYPPSGDTDTGGCTVTVVAP